MWNLGKINKSCFIFLQFLANTSLHATWSTPIVISSSISDKPDLSVDSLGNIVFTWQGYDGSNYVVQSRRKPALGSLSSIVTLSAAGSDAQAPFISHDALGNCVAVWSRYDTVSQSSVIQAATLPINGSWSTPVNISSPGGNADSVVLAMDIFGLASNAIAVWHRFNGSNFIIQGALLPAGGHWSAAQNISASGGDALIPQVAIDSSGNAVITCIRFDGEDFDILSASQLYSQPWGPSFTLSVPGETGIQPFAGVNRTTGKGYVMWSQSNGSHDVIYFSSLPIGGSWSSPVVVSSTSQDSYIPMFVVDPSGNITAIWSSFNGSNYILQGARLPINGSWSSPVTISNTTMDVGNIDLCVDALGNVTAIWDVYQGEQSKVQSAKLPLNGSWSTPVDVSTPGTYAYLPDSEVDGSGNVTGAWLEYNGSYFVVVTATNLIL